VSVSRLTNLYTFFGLPDPTDARGSDADSPPPSTEAPSSRSATSVLADQSFHDLGEVRWQAWVRSRIPVARRAIRYVTPDEMYRLPTHAMANRLLTGDIIVVDLRDLLHMNAQQDACRREVGGLSERLGTPIFALDEEEMLLLIPGAASIIDTQSHHLGVHDEVLEAT